MNTPPIQKNNSPTRSLGGSDTIAAEFNKIAREGFGELTHPLIETFIARTMLFERIENRAQRQLRTLRDACLPLLEELMEEGKIEHAAATDYPQIVLVDSGQDYLSRTVHLIKDFSTLSTAAAYYKSADRLKLAITRWAAAFSLDDLWFVDPTTRNVLLWRAKAANAPLDFNYGGSYCDWHGVKFVLLPDGFNSRTLSLAIDRTRGRADIPALAAYDPLIQTREQYLETATEMIKAYLAGQEERYTAAGCVQTSRHRIGKKTGAAPSPPWRHMDWFVRSQICGLQFRSIAAKVKDHDESTIRKGVKRAADALGVPLRASGTKRRDPGSRGKLK